ncbi:efflux RND transporter periplasmic adaptor subunit [Synechococcus sp. PCC 7336]|uniref:efflux RND transporter periplasmic adaptor subunit n=1 Tax=Synechococcus sp. PCC 7336 TaxID=195250 RepID=UPI00034D47C8|nr:efflux RND transporter periplasmic adaptor subunit [Synechococcus sp. PCC 7336]
MMSESAIASPIRKSLRLWISVAIAAGLALSGAAAVISQSREPEASDPYPTSSPEIKTVTALGWLEPQGEVVQLSAPSSTDGNRIAQLLVQEGDVVEVGQTIAILDNRDRLQAALLEARAQVAIAEANLAVVEAGAKTGEIEAQRATIARYEAELLNNTAAQTATVARLEAELQTAVADERRYRELYEQGAISASEWDSRRLASETAQRQLDEGKANLARIQSAQQQQLNEAIATLDRIAEVRPVDVNVAAAEVRAARAAVERAQSELDLAYIRASQSGQILKIHTRPGEVISTDGIVDIGQTSQMVAIAEIYESDIHRVRLGQQARVVSRALPDMELHGRVEQVDLQVRRQTVINEDPAANIDAKTVEVKVLLDEAASQQVSGLTNLRVTVTIDTGA